MKSNPAGESQLSSQKKTASQRLEALEAGEKLLAYGLQQRADTEQALLVLINAHTDKLNQRLDAFDKRLVRLEQLCSLAPGQVNLTDAYQLIVDDLGAVKRAVVELQQRARGDAGQTAPDLSIPSRH